MTTPNSNKSADRTQTQPLTEEALRGWRETEAETAQAERETWFLICEGRAE